jgi:nucleotide-binding universal stress UspA family protein
VSHRDQRVHSDPLAPGAGTGGTASDESPPPGEVVVGVDGSPESLVALGWARTEASTRGVGLHAVIAWELPVESTFGAMVTVGDFHPVVAAEETLAKALADIGISPADETVTTAAVEGHAAEVLLQAAAHAQLLVVGSRGHSKIIGALLASVSHYLAAHAPFPVVVIRPGAAEVNHPQGPV